MRCSVVIPALNEERFIGDCLRAIRDQTVDSEIIVIDGGSQDRTFEIAESLANKVISTPKTKIAEARQIGLEASRTPIYISTDADTIAPPDWLEKLIRHFSDPNIVAVGGPITTLNPGPLQDLYLKCLNGAASRGLFIGSNTAFRKNTLLRAGGYNKIRKGEDWLAAARVSTLGKTIYEPEAYILTEVPINRQLEFITIIASVGATTVGAAIKSPTLTGLGTGFLGSELIMAAVEEPSPLHHSQLAIVGLGLLTTFPKAVKPKIRDALAGILTGVLSHHYVTEDVLKPEWLHANGALITGILLLLA